VSQRGLYAECGVEEWKWAVIRRLAPEPLPERSAAYQRQERPAPAATRLVTYLSKASVSVGACYTSAECVGGIVCRVVAAEVRV
jgi:hypothetical protein